MPDKPFAESCVQNREPIFAVIQPRLRDCRDLLEIGSGTGQHAVYFAPGLPQLRWHTSDVAQNHPGILAWIEEAGVPNIEPPIRLDVLDDAWPVTRFDAVFSANTAHIMAEDAVVAMFSGVSRVLREGGLFLLYGPFNYEGKYTAPSNERFDAWRKQRDPTMGIRDLRWLEHQAGAVGMQLEEDVAMPADNRVLVWSSRGLKG